MGPRRPRSFLAALALMLVPLTTVVAGAQLLRERSTRCHHPPVDLKHRLVFVGAMQYEMDVGRWPDTLRDLISDPGVAGWSGPYTDNGKIPDDPWGNPLWLLRHRDRIYIVSAGRPGGKYPIIFPEPQ